MRQPSFKVKATRKVFQGRVFTLNEKEILFSNGHRSTYQIVDHPGAVAIVPRFANGDVLLLKQPRVAAGKSLLEIPAGTQEKGEVPLKTAKREIIEETGYRARVWKKLSEFYTAPGFCSERMVLYLATDLVPEFAECDADEFLEPIRVPYKKALRMIQNGNIEDAKSIVGLLMLRK